MPFILMLQHLSAKLDEKNFEGDVKDKASIYVPAIGKVTIVMLLRNLVVSGTRYVHELLNPG